LDFAARAGLGAFEAIENGGWQDVAAGNGEVAGGVFIFWFFDKVADAQQAFTERRLRSGFAGYNSVEMRFVSGNFFNRDGAGAGTLCRRGRSHGPIERQAMARLQRLDPRSRPGKRGLILTLRSNASTSSAVAS